MKKQIDINIWKARYYYEKGKGAQRNWYEDEGRELVQLLPEFEGLPILRVFAVTSMSTSIEANVSLAIKALLQLKRKEEFNGFLPNQIKYLNLIKEGKDVPGRKIGNFIKALEGDPNAVVVDIWLQRIFETIRGRKLPDGRDYWLAPTKGSMMLLNHL